jgi:UPF0271 protein
LEALRAHRGIIDAVVSERYALVAFDPEHPPEGLDAVVERATDEPIAAIAPREHAVRVRYAGADLTAIAAALGGRPEDVVSLHTAGRYRVAAMGFLPGFAYLSGLDPRLHVARRASPRTRIPALSVAIGGPYTGIYPFASPGGWHLLGEACGFVPFAATCGATLSLGDHVTFCDATP